MQNIQSFLCYLLPLFGILLLVHVVIPWLRKRPDLDYLVYFVALQFSFAVIFRLIMDSFFT